MELIVQFGFFLTLLGVGFWVGGARERRHYRDIERREADLLSLPVRADHILPEECSGASLVTGSVVVANDFFKMTAASLRNLFGGRMSSFESLMDRARREAVLRLKEKARAWGADEVIHLRLVTARLGHGGVEVLAVGTALKK